MPAQVDGHGVMARLAQPLGHPAPGIARLAAAVRQQNRWRGGIAKGLAHDPHVAFWRASLEHRPLPFPSGPATEIEMPPDRRHVAVRLEREHHGVQMFAVAQVHVYN